MQIQSCSHPISIVNETGHMYVPCGKCKACLHNFRVRWQERLDLEAKASQGVSFFTLTYSNDNLPLMEYDENTNAFYSNRTSEDDIYLDDYQLRNIVIPKISNYDNDKAFGYVSKTDIQKFFKRLRRLVEYDKENLLSEVSRSDRSFRYFVCAEYGPRTFRPHFHGLLYFSNKRVQRAVDECYIYKAWKLCAPSNLKCETVVTTASGYVSKYVNSFTSLPPILQLAGKTKIFYLASRRPAVGVRAFDYTSLVARVENRCVTYDKVVNVENTLSTCSMLYPDRVSSYYFAKPYRANTFGYKELYSFYSTVYKYISLDDYHNLSLLENDNERMKYISKRLPNYCSYVNSLVNITKLRSRSKATLNDVYPHLTREQKLFGINQNRSCLIKFCLRGFSNVHDYILHYLDYYSLRFAFTIKNFYELQEEYIKKGYTSLQIAKYFYPSFFVSLPLHNYEMSEDQRLDYEMMLSALNISDSDIYCFGKRVIDANTIADEYRISSDFSSYLNKVTQKLLDFEKKRDINHYINLKQNNYETF